MNDYCKFFDSLGSGHRSPPKCLPEDSDTQADGMPIPLSYGLTSTKEATIDLRECHMREEVEKKVLHTKL